MGRSRRSGAFKGALRHRDYRLLLAGFAISTAGDWLYGVALVAFVFEETRSPTWVAAASILRLLPYVLFGALGGVLADRYDRRTVMIYSDIARAALMFGIAAVVAASGPVALALALTFLSTAAGTPYGPALAAMTPSVVEESELAGANALMSSLEHVALIIGPAFGGLLLLVGSPAMAFAINGVTFATSALCVVLVTSSKAIPGPAEAEEGSLGDRLIQGFKSLMSSGEIAVLVTLVGAAAFAYGGELVLLVIVAEQRLGLGTEGIGFLLAAVGVGGIIAAGFTSRLAESDRPAVVLTAAVLVAGLPLSLLAFVNDPLPAYLLLVVEGAGSIVLDVVAITLLQRVVPENVMARVFGVLDSVVVAGVLAGSLVAPPLITAVGLEATLVVFGAGLVCALLIAAPKLRAVDRAAREKRDRLSSRVATLARVAAFQGAPRQTLEAMAQALHREDYSPGSTIVRQGEPADDFFVVVSGQLDVLSSGESGASASRVNTLSNDDYFGEIGLLERIPRTATVRARTDCTVYRIPGDAFLDAVNRQPAVSGTLLDGVVGRLARTHPSYRPVTSGQGIE
jgi:MFS family permease